MADVTLLGFGISESVSAYTSLGAAATATVTSGADGSVAFTGLPDGRNFIAVGATSGIQKSFSTATRPQRTSREVTVSVDLASIAANTTAAVNVTLPAGSADVGDVVLYRGADSLENGLVFGEWGGGVPAQAGALDDAARTFRFLVLKV